MEEKLKEKVHQGQMALISAIQALVAIPSVRGEGTADAPFGEGPKVALLHALKLAEMLGFKTKNIDNIVGYAEWPVEEDLQKDRKQTSPENYLGIFGHVDVVPAGEGWTYDPWGQDIAKGKMYGRGVLDNKGPTLANLYALYFLKEAGIRFPYLIRLVFGTNEESGFGCIYHYLKQEPAPFFGWTPDNKWPVIWGEKGRLKVRVKNIANYVKKLPEAIECRGKTEETATLVIPHSYTCEKVLHYFPRETEVVLQREPYMKEVEPSYIEPLERAYAYVRGSGDNLPHTTSGGTYMRAVPGIVNYGPSFPGQNHIAHLPDEWLAMDDLEDMTLIYTLALYYLSKRGLQDD